MPSIAVYVLNLSYQAVYALARQPTAIVSSTLTRTVLVSNYHYRIRCEAASALVSVSE
jgi:transcription initiation factor TFIID subunit 2